MFILNNCPVCGSNQFQPFITCKDYTVSKENFNIVSCKECAFKFTNPRPEDSTLGRYYKSEDYISHSDTKKGIVPKLYHFVRSYTLSKKEKLLSGYVSRGTLLDYGCGTGMFLQQCKQRGWNVYGIEPDDGARAITVSRGVSAVKDLSSVYGSMKYDAITLWHVLEHVDNLSTTISAFKTLLKGSGVLVIAVPNYKSYDAGYYGEFWAAYDVPRHLYHFDASTIQLLMRNHGFKLVDALPMKFDSFYVSLLSEKYKTGRSNLLSAFWRGFLSNIKAKSANDYSSVIYVFKKA